jgi:hypothetical protein
MSRFDRPEKVKVETSKDTHSNKQTVVMTVPPIPIGKGLTSLPEDKVILRYMFSMSGTIDKALIEIGSIVSGNKLASIVVSITDNQGAGRSATLRIPKGIKTYKNLDIEVQAGDKLTISAEEDLLDVWVSAMFKPFISEASRISMAMEAIAAEEVEASGE